MADITIDDVLPLARKLSWADQQQLIATLEAERPLQTKNPFLELVGAGSELGEDGVNELIHFIDGIRKPPRPFTFPEEVE